LPYVVDSNKSRLVEYLWRFHIPVPLIFLELGVGGENNVLDKLTHRENVKHPIPPIWAFSSRSQRLAKKEFHIFVTILVSRRKHIFVFFTVLSILAKHGHIILKIVIKMLKDWIYTCF
jgi:hypothetical protein